MQKVKIGLGILLVCIFAISETTEAVGTTIPPADGKIIPVAERAREHVYEHPVFFENPPAPEHSPVITIVDENWVLTPSSKPHDVGPPDDTGLTIPPAHEKIIPLADIAKGNGKAPLHSAVIDIDDGNWVLSLPNVKEPGFPVPDIPVDVLLGVNRDFSGAFSTELTQEHVGLDVATVPDSSSFAATPEPSTMVLLTLGALCGTLVRRKSVKSACPVI